jgi:fluoride ion exporter CrcB/FEX
VDVLPSASFVAFASWNLQMTQMLVRGDVADALAGLALGTLVAVSCFELGADISTVITSRRPQHRDAPATPPGPACSDRWATALAAATLCAALAAAVAGYVLDTGSAARAKLYVAVLFAPAGALGRWQLARLNGRSARLPCGTLAANLVACGLDGVLAAVLLRVESGSRAGVVLDAGVAGLGGALSTVSTWVGEVSALRKARETVAWAYLYVGASVILAQVIGVLAYGIAYWLE